ncbi:MULTISPECIES: DNA translocase FtsK [unclassified Collimonas]|uniref:DNA translocase FtsK n=1 Tax=unclassified Collimonas TaxID=2634148 RepID=UPI002100CC92|nr:MULTISPECIES: DNA translocase FtsK [unclassified Collimonas]HWW99637.1 DNA translocase FtsK [Collimonas sp.]
MDPLYAQAVAIVREQRRPSISLVQRVLRIGYNRAARLLEQMEFDAIVSPMHSDGTRTLLKQEA